MDSKNDILSKLTATRNIIKKKFQHAYEERLKRERKVAEALKPITSKIDALKSTQIIAKEKNGKNKTILELDEKTPDNIPDNRSDDDILEAKNNKFDAAVPSTSSQSNHHTDYDEFQNMSTSTPKVKFDIKADKTPLKKIKLHQKLNLPRKILDFSESPEALRILDHDRVRREDIISDIAMNAVESVVKREPTDQFNTSGQGIKKNYNSIDFNFVPYHRNNHIIYEYVTDPNELCNRLRLLISSKMAGNTNHIQEIQSIINELRKLGCIT